MKANSFLIVLLCLALYLFRCFFGLQVNFSHADYHQIYLIGLEYLTSNNWPYWGPDIVWSKTQLPGGLQALLVGDSINFFNHYTAPIFISNLFSSFGLILLSLYISKRLTNLPPYLILLLTHLFAFNVFHGAVLLNTAYLLFSGALVFISVLELFLFAKNTLLPKKYYFLAIGLALTFTMQLHLSWVMILPYLMVLLFFELKQGSKSLLTALGFLIIGIAIGGVTLFPTIAKFGTEIFSNSDGNVAFDITRLKRFGDLFIRYIGIASFEINPRTDINKLAIAENNLIIAPIWIMRIIGAAQVIFMLVGIYFIRKQKEIKRSLVLFGLSYLMALVLYLLSNKHLSVRTYILLYPIPIWFFFQAFSYWVSKYKSAIQYMLVSCIIALFSYFGIAYLNAGSKHSFKYWEYHINTAIKKQDIECFGKRRVSRMKNSLPN